MILTISPKDGGFQRKNFPRATTATGGCRRARRIKVQSIFKLEQFGGHVVKRKDTGRKVLWQDQEFHYRYLR